MTWTIASRIRTACIAGTLVALTFIAAFTTMSLGQDSTGLTRLNVWNTINSPVSDAMVRAAADHGMDISLVEPGELKVGYPYRFASYDLVEGAKMSLRFVLDPPAAIATRKFEVFDVSDLNVVEWQKVRGEFSENPGRTAVLVRYDSGYVGMPVKWNRELATTIEAGLLLAEKAGDPTNSAVAAAVAQIVDRGAYDKSIAPLLSDSAYFDAYFEAADVRSVLDKYYSGDQAAFKDLVPQRKVFIAISNAPGDFGVSPADHVITKGGASGQPLGTVMPSWPSVDD